MKLRTIKPVSDDSIVCFYFYRVIHWMRNALAWISLLISVCDFPDDFSFSFHKVLAFNMSITTTKNWVLNICKKNSIKLGCQSLFSLLHSFLFTSVAKIFYVLRLHVLPRFGVRRSHHTTRFRVPWSISTFQPVVFMPCFLQFKFPQRFSFAFKRYHFSFSVTIRRNPQHSRLVYPGKFKATIFSF